MGVKVGLIVCYKLRFPEHARALALQGAQVLINVGNWPDGSGAVPDVLAPCRALENRVHLIACNRAGQENGLSFMGKSVVCGPNGDFLARAGAGEEMLTVDIDPAGGLSGQRLTGAGYELDLRSDRRPDLYGSLTLWVTARGSRKSAAPTSRVAKYCVSTITHPRSDQSGPCGVAGGRMT